MWGRGQPQTVHKNSVPDFSLHGRPGAPLLSPVGGFPLKDFTVSVQFRRDLCVDL